MALQEKSYFVEGQSPSYNINYKFTLRIVENSVDKDLNTSNLTVQAILQSDKAKTSFLGQPCYVTIELADKQVVHRGAWRDCIGTGEHIYETWTGDVEHDSDGTLDMSIYACLDPEGSFKDLPPVMRIQDQSIALTPIIKNEAPGVPEGFEAVYTDAGKLQIRWQEPEDPDGNLEGYILERSEDGGASFSQVYCGPESSYIDTSADAGITTIYRVCAIDAEGVASEWTDSIEAVANYPPALMDPPVLYCNAAGTVAATYFLSGRPLWLYPGSWTDHNLAGASLCVEVQTKTKDGEISDWSPALQAYPLAEILQITPQTTEDVECIRYRVACADALGAVSDWAETAWLQHLIPHILYDGSWRKPRMNGLAVMPYVRGDGAWVRHGGDSATKRLELPALKDRYNWDKEGSTSMITKSAVREIHFVRNFVPPDETTSWNAGVEDGAITGYIADNVVTISANGHAGFRIGANGINFTNAFSGFVSLERITGLELIDASEASSLGGLFAGCSSLIEADLSTWRCDSATSLSGMFNNCSALKRVRLPYSLPKCTAAYGVVGGCSSLEYADLGGLIVKNIASNANYPIFAGCTNLKETVIATISMLTDAIENNAPLFNGCTALEKLTIRTGSQISRVSLFEDNLNIKEITFGGGLTEIPEKTFAKCVHLEKVSGLGRVTKIGARAFIYCSSLKYLDLNPEIITEIGESAFRLSCAEDCVDLSKLPAGCSTGLMATRSDRWSDDQLREIREVSIPTVLLEVPGADSQMKYTDVIFGYGNIPFDDTNDIIELNVGDHGCSVFALYHEWNCVYRDDPDKIKADFMEFWEIFTAAGYPEINDERKFGTKGVMPLLRKTLNWVPFSSDPVVGASQLSTLADRLNQGLPTTCSMQSANIEGAHSVLVVGGDSATGKLAVLDAKVSAECAVLNWVRFEDLFVNGATDDRIWIHTYN